MPPRFFEKKLFYTKKSRLSIHRYRDYVFLCINYEKLIAPPSIQILAPTLNEGSAFRYVPHKKK